MKAGDSVEMNKMFRARIYAQFFTLVAVVAGGMYYKTERQQRREFEKMVEQRKAQEKRDAWLRELEIRDKEDKDWRERHAAIEAAAKEAGKRPAPKSFQSRTLLGQLLSLLMRSLSVYYLLCEIYGCSKSELDITKMRHLPCGTSQ